MRRLVVAALALVATSVFAIERPAFAASTDAAGFAAQCSSATTPTTALTVSTSLNVLGGSGAFTGDCTVDMAPGAQLTLTNVTLTGPGIFRVFGEANSKFFMNGASVTTAGRTVIVPGNDFVPGNPPTFVSKDGGEARIQGSTLTSTGSFVSVLPSPNANDGKVYVVNSRLTSVSSGALAIVAVGASCGGGPGRCDAGPANPQRGVAQVSGSRLDAGTGVLTIETEALGKTTATNNTLIANSILIHAGAGGTCQSSGNSPPIPCS